MTRKSEHPHDPPLETRPLPTSLTRFLSHPTGLVAPSHEGRARRVEPSTPKLAFRLAIGWAVFYNLAGFAILWWLWSTMG